MSVLNPTQFEKEIKTLCDKMQAESIEAGERFSVQMSDLIKRAQDGSTPEYLIGVIVAHNVKKMVAAIEAALDPKEGS